MRWSDNIRRVAHLRARIFRHPLSRRTVENLYFFYRTYCKFGSEVVTGKKGKSEDDNWNQTRELGRYISRERNSGESFEMRSSRSSLSRVIESVNFSWNLPSLVPPSPIHRMVNVAFRKFCDEDRLTSPHRPTARIQDINISSANGLYLYDWNWPFSTSFSLPLYPYDQNQIHQVLSSDKVQRINTPIVQLHFRTTTQTNNEQEKSQVLELDKSELETVIASLEEAKEALARLNDTNSKK